MRFKYYQKHENLHLDLTPLIDVVFLLIIFFLVTSSFVQMKGIKIQLPEVAQSTSGSNVGTLIEIDASGSYYFNAKKVTFHELQDHLKTLDKSRPITIRSDKKVSFGAVMKVWDEARMNKVSEIMILTNEG